MQAGVTIVGPEVKHGLFRVAGRARNPKKASAGGPGTAEQGVREAHSDAAGRLRRRRTP